MPEGNSIEDILLAIKKEQALIHPDKNEGKGFAKPEDESRWHRLSEAKQFLESYQVAVIPVSQLPALINAIRAPVAETQEDRSSRLAEMARVRLRQQYFAPKLTSCCCAAVFAFLVTASSSLKTNPVLGVFFENPQMQRTSSLALLTLLLYSGLFFILAWVREAGAQRRVEWMLTTDGIQDSLLRVCPRLHGESAATFSFDNLVSQVVGNRKCVRW